jgi:hypothetical protein
MSSLEAGEESKEKVMGLITVVEWIKQQQITLLLRCKRLFGASAFVCFRPGLRSSRN